MYIVVEHVRSGQTCHTGANYSNFLRCFALCDRHLDDTLQVRMNNSLPKSGRSSDFGSVKWRMQRLAQQNQTRTAQELDSTRKKECSRGSVLRHKRIASAQDEL